MNRLVLSAAALLVLAPLGAAPARAGDARLASRAYNASEVVRIDGKAGVQAAIAFADDEQIENVAIGDSALWQVTPNKRATMLFVKPLSATARTNLTVVTDRRSYYFDLVASPSAQPLYVLRFTYPEEAKKGQAAAARSAALTDAESLALAAPVAEPAAKAAEPAQDPARLNFAWGSKGKRKLLPSRVYDDGSSTYLSWPEGTAMPAILIRDAGGAEGAVNFAVRDDVVVIEGVPPLLVLRSGKDAALLENRGPIRPATPRKTRTATPAATPAPMPTPPMPTVVATAAPAGQAQPTPAPSQDN